MMEKEMIVIFHEDERGIARTWSEVGEVVRCRDCRQWDKDTSDDTGYCVDFMTADEDGFCKWGIRREDE